MALPKYKSKLAERMITATAEMEKEMFPEKIKIKGNAKKIYAWIEKNLDVGM